MSFPLIANEKTAFSIETALKNNRFPHAVILEGETGLGKHTLADYLSRFLVCTDNDKPCGKCNACRTAMASSHPDIVTVAPEDKKKNVAVGQIRELIQSVYVKAQNANCRIFIIDKAETMNLNAQNALLKILEEPPANIYFILITNSAVALLETVRSRCVIFTLHPPKLEQGFEYIKKNLKPIKEDNAIKTALNEAKGNIGKAIKILKRKNANATEVAAKDFAALIFSGDEIEMLLLLSKFEKDRVAADYFFSLLKYEISDLLWKNYKKAGKAKVLTALYSKLPEFEALLKTNINLTLLFTSLVAEIKELCDEYI